MEESLVAIVVVLQLALPRPLLLLPPLVFGLFWKESGRQIECEVAKLSLNMIQGDRSEW